MRFLTQKELIPIFSTRQLYAIQAVLDASDIPYQTKAMNPLGRWGRRGHGIPFQNPDAAYEYRIFVHRDDYDRALAAIQPALRKG